MVARARWSVLLFAVALAGCDDGVMGTRPDPLLERLAELGFDATTAVDRGTHFIVEGDIMVAKAGLRAGAGGPQRPRFQYATTNRVFVQQHAVDFSAIEATSPAWAAATQGAIDAWNAVPGINIMLYKWTGNQYDPRITVTFGSTCGGNAIACAEFPTSWGEPGPTVVIQAASEPEKLYTMVHELGHTLGLRHTNWNNRTCSGPSGLYPCSEPDTPEGAVHIPNTPTSYTGGPISDSASVMNAVVQTWNGFSPYDRIAARYLFPGGKGPDASASLSGTTPVIQWAALGDVVSYEVYYLDMSTWPGTENLVGSTAGTSLADYSRSFTSAQPCPLFFSSGYFVRAVFAGGTRSDRWWEQGMACYS